MVLQCLRCTCVFGQGMRVVQRIPAGTVFHAVFGYDRNRFKRFVTENREHADGDERHILSEWLSAITGCR